MTGVEQDWEGLILSNPLPGGWEAQVQREDRTVPQGVNRQQDIPTPKHRGLNSTNLSGSPSPRPPLFRILDRRTFERMRNV